MLHKPFQRDDLAAAACVDSLILAWEQGLGKTIAAFTWPFLKRAKRTLLIVPGHLHAQYQADAARHYKVHVPILRTHEDLTLWRINTALPIVPDDALAQYFLISYEALTRNGADEIASMSADLFKSRMISLATLAVEEFQSVMEDKPMSLSHYYANIGITRNDITCIWQPSIATTLAAYQDRGWGFDCIVADEATRLQSDSQTSLGVRRLQPPYRMLMTGTPIKNRLESIFYLAWFASGGQNVATAKFPYTVADKAKFSRQHLEIDRFITREEEKAALTGENRNNIRIQKLSARVCNVHRLWKMFAPFLIRRRKADSGESIVMKTTKTIYTPLSAAQKIVYGQHLQNRPFATSAGKLVNNLTGLGMQLTNLRLAACCPDAASLADVRNGGKPSQLKSWSPWTPKLRATLSLIADLLAHGEQVVVGSPFTHFNDNLLTFLTQANVRAMLLDGRITPAERGKLVEEFKSFDKSVLICGLTAMSEGINLPQCSHLIQAAPPWALDTTDQFIARIWRISSEKPVTVYHIISENTIEARILALYEEKKDTSDLTLDGGLYEDESVEMDSEKMLHETRLAFAQMENSDVTELILESQWPALLVSLRHGQTTYDQFHPPYIPGTSAEDTAEALTSYGLNIGVDTAKNRLANHLNSLRKKPNT